MPKITLSLNTASIEAAIAQVEKYQLDISKKAKEIQRRVAEQLRELAAEGFNGAIYDDVIHEGMRVPDVSVTIEPKGEMLVVVAYGSEAVFAEFGAGVYYNPSGSPHPLQPAGVVPIGTYGKGYGARKIWGYYEDGELKLTHGNPASMPMYLALQAVIKMIPDIAKEVFST